MPAEGLDWLPDRADADRRRGRAADHDRRGAARRPGGAVHRRRAAPAPRAGRHRADARTHSASRRRSPPTPSGSRGPRRRSPTPASTGSTPASTRCDRRRSRPSPAATASKDVVAGLEAAKAAGLGPIKLNAVLLRGTNDDQAAELLHWAVEHHYELRFIEQMPLDAQHDWSRDRDGDRRRDLRAAHCRVHPHAPRRAARQRPGRALRRRRRAGDRRHHRLGHPPVLRRLRPRPAHRRRPGPQLPVRPRGVRPPHGAALRRRATRRSPSGGSSPCSASVPATASTT